MQITEADLALNWAQHAKDDLKILARKVEELERRIAQLESAQQGVHPTNGGLALRACVSAHCGWVGKESACLTWKHAGDERMCPHCHDNTELIPLSAISG